MRRYAPSQPLPAYAFVPGRRPHPRGPGGHSHGLPPAPEELLDPQGFWRCGPYLSGIDLFNHGYYWEAHEAWEVLWRAEGRPGAVTALLQGLIRLAAAGVKVRQEQPESVRRHAEAARRLFAAAGEAAGAGALCGLDLGGLAEFADRISSGSASSIAKARGAADAPALIVFDEPLVLTAGAPPR